MRVNFNKEIMYGLMGSSHLTIGGNCKTYETVRPIYLESGRIHDILRKLKKSQRLEILMLILNSLIFQTICRKISWAAISNYCISFRKYGCICLTSIPLVAVQSLVSFSSEARLFSLTWPLPVINNKNNCKNKQKVDGDLSVCVLNLKVV